MLGLDCLGSLTGGSITFLWIFGMNDVNTAITVEKVFEIFVKHSI